MNDLALTVINDQGRYKAAMHSLKAGHTDKAFRELCRLQVGVAAYVNNRKFDTVYTEAQRAEALEDVIDHYKRAHAESGE